MQNHDDSSEEKNLAARPLWIVWIGFMSVLGSYLVVALQQGQQDAAPELDLASITLALSVAALGGSVVSLFFMKKLFASLPFFTYSIVRWAIADAVATFGLVLFFLGATLPTFLMFLSWAAGLFVMAMPTAAAQEAWSTPADR